MRLLELCLLTALSPQDPTPAPTGQEAPAVVAPAQPTGQATPTAEPTEAAPNPAPTAVTATPTATEPTATPTPPQDPAAVVATAEQAGDSFDGDALVRVTHGDDEALANRAVAVLGKAKKGAGSPFLQQIVASGKHGTTRALAMQALARAPEVGITSTAIEALGDTDRRVRTFAAETLGKLRRPAAVEPLLAVLDRTRTEAEPGVATDVQAALLALHDLGATDNLLRAATAVHDGKAEGAGEALAYFLQERSHGLPRNDELTLLLAVLGHREQLVRRFAIGRLAELGERSAAAALEKRLGVENDQLRPMLEAALMQLRHDPLQQPTDELALAKDNAKKLWHKATTWWNAASPTEQGIAAGTPVALLLFAWLLGRRRRAQAAAAEAAAMAAMVAPSEEYAEQVAAEAAELVAAAEEFAQQDAPAAEQAAGDETFAEAVEGEPTEDAEEPARSGR
ncbi:MAG: HEAT repeat domain-containing protein [Planctomycetota bacterium]|jgi:uncharacterized protein (TIGR03382 family)